MKHSMIAVSSLGLFFGIGLACAQEPAEVKTEPAETTESVEVQTEASQATESVELTTNDAKVNYSLGFELGKDLQRQELPLMPDALLKGAEDGVSGRTPKVNTRQRAAALKEIKEKRAQANLEQSQAFLAANAEKEGVQTLPSGLQYKVIQEGEGRTPGPDDSVVVHYSGSFVDGTVFDSSYDRGKPATLQMKKVIKGWKEALAMMKEGAKWELFIPPELAYGKQGRAKAIPPNSALIFEVELISIK